jgi:hypothetical protein
MMSSHTSGNQTSEKPRSGYFALSVRQPWAYLIVMGQKTIELRDWATTYRGMLLIHAAKQVDERAMHYFDLQDSGLDLGCLVGAVELVDVLRMTPDTLRARQWEHRDFGPFAKSKYGFVLQTLQVFSEPIPMLGNQGIFSIVNPEIETAVREQLVIAQHDINQNFSEWR